MILEANEMRIAVVGVGGVGGYVGGRLAQAGEEEFQIGHSIISPSHTAWQKLQRYLTL